MKNKKTAFLLLSSLLLTGCQLVNMPTFSSVTQDSTPVISSESDSSSSFSSSSATPYWQEPIKTLFIGETQEDIDKYNALVSDNEYMTVDSYLRATTDEEGNEISTYPTSLEDLTQYNQIVLSDTDITSFPASTEETAEDGTVTHTDGFVDNLEKAVSEYGVNLFTYGFTNGRMTLNNDVKKFSEMLPIDYDKEDEYHAVEFLCDVSGSMEANNRFSKMKTGIINSLSSFSENDEIGVTVFGDSAKCYQAMTKIKDNVTTITSSIKKITEQGGTNIVPGLKLALTHLNASSAKFKHVIVFSDGEPTETQTEITKQIKKFVTAGIDCSFINIQNSSGASLLKKLAKAGNGSYYYASTSSATAQRTTEFIQDYVLKKTYTSTETDEEGNITPLAVNYVSSGELNIESCEVPGITGLYYASQRDNAYNILSVTNTYTQNKVDEEGNTVTDEEGNTVTETINHEIPLLSYWEYGKGKVASFNAPLNSEWTTSFLAEDSNGLKLLKDSAHL